MSVSPRPAALWIEPVFVIASFALQPHRHRTLIAFFGARYAGAAPRASSGNPGPPPEPHTHKQNIAMRWEVRM